MDEKVIQLINRLKVYLVDKYGDRIKDVILYGSHARGESTEDSDIDILILVDDSLNHSEVRESVGDLLFDILLESGELISVVVLPESFFKKYDYPFMLNVRREGIKV